MAKLYLQALGGLGARINTLLSVLYGLDVNKLPHELCVYWPLNIKHINRSNQRKRESIFAAKLEDLYEVKRPICYIEAEEFADAISKHTVYDLEHTQAPGRDPLTRQSIPFCTQPHHESFCVQGHQWMNIDGLHSKVLHHFSSTYDNNLKLKPEAEEARDLVIKKFSNRRVIGLYIRQATTNRAVRSWRAYERMLPLIRKEALEDSSTLFFVCADDPSYVRLIYKELLDIDKSERTERLIVVPKPNRFNDIREMLCVTADIELMRHVDEFYPTWNSGLGVLMTALRKEKFDCYGNTTKLGGGVFKKDAAALCQSSSDPLEQGGWILTQ